MTVPDVRTSLGPEIASPAYARAWGKLKAGADPSSLPVDEQSLIQVPENWAGRRYASRRYGYDWLQVPVTDVFCEAVYAAAMHAGLRGVEAVLRKRD